MVYLAESDVVVLLLHDLLHCLLVSEGDEAEASALVGLAFHRQLHCLHLIRHHQGIYLFTSTDLHPAVSSGKSSVFHRIYCHHWRSLMYSMYIG